MARRGKKHTKIVGHKKGHKGGHKRRGRKGRGKR